MRLRREGRQDEAALGAFLAYVGVLDFPDQPTLDYAKIRADLQKKNTIIGANDLFIVAHARSLSLTLVTNNMVEFRRVPHLTKENWTRGIEPVVISQTFTSGKNQSRAAADPG